MVNIKLEKIKWEELTHLDGLNYSSESKNETRWTKKAWLILAAEGLTKYPVDNGCEKIKVIARYIALSILRYQFSEIIYDENSVTQEYDFDYSNFVADFSKYGITLFDFGYLMALEKEWNYVGEDSELRESSALSYFVNKYSRQEVIKAFKHSLEEPSEILLFFYKLVDWNTDRSILNNNSSGNIHAFSWIDNDFCL